MEYFIIICFSIILLTLSYLVLKYRKKSKENEYWLYHDYVTGHYTWNWLWNYLYKEDCPSIKTYTFVHFDIKDFKMVNELFGYENANQLLCEIVKVLNSRKDFIIYSARCHEDNFAFIAKRLNENELKLELQKLFEDIQQFSFFPNYKIYYRCGAVEVDEEVKKRGIISDLAKIAQAQGKRSNCTDITIYTAKMKEDLFKGKKLRVELFEAIERDDILVYFQPKFHTVTEEIYGAEVLVRWNYLGAEMRYPGSFIPYFEKDNTIMILDEVVLKKACQALKSWMDSGLKIYPISINLSQAEIQKENLVESVYDIVSSHGIDCSLIEFELTESAAYKDREYLLNVMRQLKNKGFRISMDDFGTGYSSLNLLKDMPLDTLKIDKSFIDGITKESVKNKSNLIVKDILSMSKHLGITSVAEGVEDEEQQKLLKKWKCDYIQGYYYSKAVPKEEYEKYLQSVDII